MPRPKSNAPLARWVREAVQSTEVLDIHTHLTDPALGALYASGIDELLTYHYLVAEWARQTSTPLGEFWAAPKARQAELVWETLFVKNVPLSEACRGVLTTLHALGVDTRKRDLAKVRKWYAGQDRARLLDQIFKLARVRAVYMTNSPFDDEERPYWEKGFTRDDRFRAALRIDPLLLQWPVACKKLAGMGYKVTSNLNSRTLGEIRRFLEDWTKKLGSSYVMVSLTPGFAYPEQSDCARFIDGAVLPFCRDHGQPFALMMGVKRAVNPALRMAGDGVGRNNLEALQNLCTANPANRFAVTVLSRENQHELCVLARKFPNLHPFGCWWFTNIPSQIREILEMRLELLGPTFTPQHSDARVVDQLVYKWSHTREILADVLVTHYERLAATGVEISRAEVQKNAADLLGGAFERLLKPGA